MSQSIKAEDSVWMMLYDASSPRLFEELAQQLRRTLGSVALRIDHIGSTSIPQLATKPIIDIQISVANFEPAAAYDAPLMDLGFLLVDHKPERSKQYLRTMTMQRRAYVHVRRTGEFNERFALLYRDYLRAHPDVASHYTDLRLACAQRYYHDDNCRDYTEAMRPFIWQIFAQAGKWAQQTAWSPGLSDA